MVYCSFQIYMMKYYYDYYYYIISITIIMYVASFQYDDNNSHAL